LIEVSKIKYDGFNFAAQHFINQVLTKDVSNLNVGDQVQICHTFNLLNTNDTERIFDILI